jgi:hypothetical protein
MNRDLMLAVLAMDAYNSVGNIGTATNKNADITPAMDAAGFSAQAYTYGGETIISYRGTDGFDDVLNGWGGGAGLQTTQAGMAAAFYKSVVGANAFPYSTNVAFTGHSLGGGLAGLMASLYGKSAIVYDNMAYAAAANTTYMNATSPTLTTTAPGGIEVTNANPAYQAALDTFYGGAVPQSVDSSGVTGWQLSGQIIQPGSTGTVVGSDYNWGVGPSSPGLHSMSLLVLSMYAQ